MIILILLIMIILISILTPAPVQHQTGGDSQYFPFYNPFKTTFFHTYKKIYNIYSSNHIHTALLDQSIGKESYQIRDRPVSSSILNDLHNHNLDFVVDTELNIAPSYKNQTNVRFICSLYAPALLLLSPNSDNILDIGDIKYFNCEVGIGILAPQTSERYQTVLHLLSFYIPERRNIKIYSMNEEELLQGYGSKFRIYADLATYRNRLVHLLTDKLPSHFVSMRKINGGSYHITDSEKPFYSKYPYFKKEMLDIKQMQRYYPSLTQVHNRDLYYPTIKVHYILLCNKGIPNKTVEDILHKILKLKHTRWNLGYKLNTKDQRQRYFVSKLFEDVTLTDISHLSTDIAIHPGAEKVYRDLQLHDRTGASYYSRT